MSAPVRVAVLGLGQRGLQHLTHVWRLQEQGLAEVIALGDAFADNLAEAKLQEADGDVKLAILLARTDLTVEQAKLKLKQTEGVLYKAIGDIDHE